jgi:hypothetical protein
VLVRRSDPPELAEMLQSTLDREAGATVTGPEKTT